MGFGLFHENIPCLCSLTWSQDELLTCHITFFFFYFFFSCYFCAFSRFLFSFLPWASVLLTIIFPYFLHIQRPVLYLLYSYQFSAHILSTLESLWTESVTNKLFININFEWMNLWKSEVKIIQLCLTPCDPMDFSKHNTGVCSLTLLQGIFPKQGSNPGLPYCRQIPTDQLSREKNKTKYFSHNIYKGIIYELRWRLQ